MTLTYEIFITVLKHTSKKGTHIPLSPFSSNNFVHSADV